MNAVVAPSHPPAPSRERSPHRPPVPSVEDQGIEPVAESARHGRVFSQVTFWFSASVQFATLAAGALATALLGLSFWLAVVAFVVGSGIGSLALGLLATAGPRLGTPQMVQARGPFGFRGNAVPSVLFFVTAVGWFAVSTLLGVFVIQVFWDVPAIPTVLVLTAVEVVVAVVGYRLMHRIQGVLSVVLAATFVVVSFYAFAQGHLDAPIGGAAAGALGTGGAIASVVAISASRLLSFSAAASDYSRYLPQQSSPVRVFLGVFSGSFLASSWIGIVGIALGTSGVLGSPADLVAGTLPAALAVVVLIVLLASTASNSCIDIYSSSLSVLTIGVRARQWVTGIVVGVVGAILASVAALGDYYAQFESFLILLGYWLAPFVAIMLTQLVLGARGEKLLGELYDTSRRFGPGLVAFVVGLACSIPFINSQLYIGPFARLFPQLGDITAVVGAVVAAAGYALLVRARSGRPA